MENLRHETYYINSEVNCINCGDTFIPSQTEGLKELNIPTILANNFCSRKCYDKHTSKCRRNPKKYKLPEFLREKDGEIFIAYNEGTEVTSLWNDWLLNHNV